MALPVDSTLLVEDVSSDLIVTPAYLIKRGDKFRLERTGSPHLALLDAIVNKDGTISIPCEQIKEN